MTREPSKVATAHILTEQACAAVGSRSFNASTPVLRWDVVRIQMLYLHGCAKVTKDA